MPSKVFQVQAKDSVVKFNAFDAVNGIQNLSTDPTFNEEYYTELGNVNYTAQSRNPETAGSFEVTATGSLPSILARMLYNYSTQTYMFDPATKGNAFTISEVDLENLIFDLIDLKQPGQTFATAELIPNCQVSQISIRVDATGTGSETINFEAALQEGYYKPYQDMISIPMVTINSGEIQVPAAYTSLGINSGTYAIMYVFKDNQKTDTTGNQAIWKATVSDRISVAGGSSNFTTAAPFDRVMAVLYKRVPGAFPTIYYPTSSRFVRGDRTDIWLVASGTLPGAINDATRLLRCQSADISIDLSRDKLQEIRRNDDGTTIYFRGLNYPIKITANINLLETTLQQWADLQGKTLNESAPVTPVDLNNVMNLAGFNAMKLQIKYWKVGNNTTPICTIVLDNLNITAFSERQQTGGRAERTLSYTGSEIDLIGNSI